MLVSVRVSVALPPSGIVGGVMAFANPATADVTVSGAVAGDDVPPPVIMLLVVLVTVPGVAEVTVTMIVQPPGGMLVPDATVMSVGASVTPVQVPVFADVIVTPAGIESVNGAVRISAVALAFESEIANVAESPATIDDGRIVLPSVDADAVTVSGALAAGDVPPPVTSVLVVFVIVPGVKEVTVTTIVQPPTGIIEPTGSVISAAVTFTGVQVPVLAEVVVTPAGIASVNGALSVDGVALTLPIVMVSVDGSPETIVAGRIDLSSVAAASVTVNGALAAGVRPAPVVSVLVVLVTAPGVAEVIVTMIVQPPGGTSVPVAIETIVGVMVTPVHVPVLPDVVVTPAGIRSVKIAVNGCGVAFGVAQRQCQRRGSRRRDRRRRDGLDKRDRHRSHGQRRTGRRRRPDVGLQRAGRVGDGAWPWMTSPQRQSCSHRREWRHRWPA